MFCFHKFDKIEDGYQYCKKCGKAIVAPCKHNWIHKAEYGRKFVGCDKYYEYTYVYECAICKKIRQELIK